jgi:drug/metabolite transporter (DMT)-like permease
MSERGTSVTAILAALIAAMLYGTGAALQQHQAAAAPDASAGKPSLLLLLVRRPWWLLGIAGELGGFATHAVALRSGPLTIVQMLMASSLIFSVATVRVWSGRRLGALTWAACLAVVAGIGAFVVLTSPGLSAGHHVPQHAGLAAIVLAIAAAPFAATGLAAAGRRRALLLSVGAGLADAAIAVTTMAFTHALGHGLGGILTSWATYVLMIGGPCSLLLTQTAYQAGRPMITLPVVTVVTPMASLAVGVGLLGETTRLSTAGAVVVGGAVLLTAAGLTVLARRAAHQDPAAVGAARPHRESARPRREPARPGHARPRARQFLAGACVPAAGNISFWTVPAVRPATVRPATVRPATVRPAVAEEHRSLAGCQ